MAIRDIVLSTDDFLRKKSKPVKKFDEKLWGLLDDMHETLNHTKGSGLSAVQIGSLKRVFIIDINGANLEFINPEIVKKSGKQYKEEGCLSVKQAYACVERAEYVEIKAFDRYGYPFSFASHDWTAVCLQHEYDHLEGVLYIDKIYKCKKRDTIVGE